MPPLPTEQVPGLHHLRVGEIVVTAVSDGFLNASNAVLQNIAPEEIDRLLTESFRPTPRRTSVNTFLIRAGERAALVDTGCGGSLQASAGKMLGNLAAAGVAPGEIDTVLLTHLHPDHSNALTDASGQAIFPGATLGMHAAELAYWEDEGAASRAGASGQGVPYFAAARTQVAPYRDRLALFADGAEIFPGVTAVHLPGHTPGHCGYLIASGEDSLLIWGDIVHVPEVQVARPEVTMQFDVDPAQAAETRRRVFDRVAADRQRFVGMHVHFPGCARLAKDAQGYRLVPEARDLAF